MQCETLLAVVDDDEDVRAALTRLIGSAGFAVESFASGGAFLRSVEDHKPACVVLDLHMPGMNGLDVQASLGVTHAGLPAYLCKPVNDEALLAAIDAAIVGDSI